MRRLIISLSLIEVLTRAFVFKDENYECGHGVAKLDEILEFREYFPDKNVKYFANPRQLGVYVAEYGLPFSKYDENSERNAALFGDRPPQFLCDDEEMFARIRKEKLYNETLKAAGCDPECERVKKSLEGERAELRARLERQKTELGKLRERARRLERS